MRRRFKIGSKAFYQRRAMERGKEAESKEEKEKEVKQRVRNDPAVKTVHEVILSQVQERATENASRVAKLDACVDEIIDLFLNRLEPLMIQLAEEGEPEVITVIKDVKETLEEGVYPYLDEVGDKIGDLLESEDIQE